MNLIKGSAILGWEMEPADMGAEALYEPNQSRLLTTNRSDVHIITTKRKQLFILLMLQLSSNLLFEESKGQNQVIVFA